MATTPYLLQKNIYKCNLIAGVDEAGRGALAGPVVAAAVILTSQCNPKLFKDSKQLSEKERITLYDYLLTHTPYITIGVKSHHTIDKINILNATLKAMKNAIMRLPIKPTKVLIDGNKAPIINDYKLEPIIKGDQIHPVISAASIIAKVTRDRIMQKCHLKFSHYQFDINKGYGTSNHYTNLFSYGLSSIHRKSFNLNKQQTLF